MGRGAQERKRQAARASAWRVRLDDLDVKILTLLHEDARLSHREIAERAQSTNPTVAARIKALEDLGLILGYRAQLDDTVLGGGAYVLLLTVQPPAAQGAFETVRDMPGVQRAHLLSGGRVVAHVRLRPPAYTLAHLHAALAKVPGIVTYDASEVIEGHEAPRLDGVPSHVDVACHQCKGPIHGEPVKGRFGERAHVFCCKQCLSAFQERYQSLHAAGASSKTRRP